VERSQRRTPPFQRLSWMGCGDFGNLVLKKPTASSQVRVLITILPLDSSLKYILLIKSFSLPHRQAFHTVGTKFGAPDSLAVTRITSPKKGSPVDPCHSPNRPILLHTAEITSIPPFTTLLCASFLHRPRSRCRYIHV